MTYSGRGHRSNECSGNEKQPTSENRKRKIEESNHHRSVSTRDELEREEKETIVSVYVTDMFFVWFKRYSFGIGCIRDQLERS